MHSHLYICYIRCPHYVLLHIYGTLLMGCLAHTTGKLKPQREKSLMSMAGLVDYMTSNVGFVRAQVWFSFLRLSVRVLPPSSVGRCQFLASYADIMHESPPFTSSLSRQMMTKHLSRHALSTYYNASAWCNMHTVLVSLTRKTHRSTSQGTMITKQPTSDGLADFQEGAPVCAPQDRRQVPGSAEDSGRRRSR